MKRVILLIVLVLCVALGGAYFFNRYWIHRFDALIERQAKVYRLDPQLVWSVIYQETYFKPWQVGAAGEVGLMQVTPLVARTWAQETGFKEYAQQAARDPQGILSDPERNIQIGCWYLEKLYEQYRDLPSPEARMLAAYNAGPSRVTQWDKTDGSQPLAEDAFIARIDINSTRIYVREILTRYRQNKR